MQRRHHHVPVTALAFSGQDVLLTGEGNYLVVYNRRDRKQLAIVQVFESQAIHGIITPGQDDAAGLVWGGSLVRRFHLKPKGALAKAIDLSITQHAGDWILHAAYAPLGGGGGYPLAVLVTAHNALWIAHIDETVKQDDHGSQHKFERIVAGSNCILYSAHITWLSASTCLIASGTAFGDIILWSANLTKIGGTTSAQTQTHYTFLAHQGSIFGVQISSMLKLPHKTEEVRVLATCSDDRNIKLWDVSNLDGESPTLAQVQRDTGFGSKQDETGVAPRCLAKAMGHSSRIWHVRFAEAFSGDPALKSILSFGEDGSVIEWDSTHAVKNVDRPYELTKTSSTTAHAGKNIWAVTQRAGAFATGGADGALVLHRGRESFNDSTVITSFRAATPPENDNYRAYCFIGDNRFLSTTDLGRIVILDITEPHNPAAEMVCDPLEGLRGYSIVAGIREFAFMGGTDGNVYSYSHETKNIDVVLSGGAKIAGLFTYSPHPDKVALLATGVGEEAAVAQFLIFDKDHIEEKFVGYKKLTLPPGFVTTSFAVQSFNHGRYSTNHAILGSRDGCVATYDLCQSDDCGNVRHLGLHSLVHGKEAITSLSVVRATAYDDATSSWIFSIGRDGTFAVQRINITGDDMELHLVHQLALSFGPNVEGLWISPKGSIQTWGFRSKHFVVYNATTERNILEVECGGAHRNWAYQPDEGGGTLVWTKASKVHYRHQAALPYDQINGGRHGREIKTVAISPVGTAGQIIATGAEDTDIKLFKVQDGGFRCLQTLRKHNTGIQHLQGSEDGRYLFSCGGFEEFYVWRISSGVPYMDICAVCESKHPRSGASDLRIMSFDAQMLATGVFSIVMAYSDSSVKIWQYVYEAWQQVASGDYLTACLTNVMRPRTEHGEDTGLLTTATDGHIIQWKHPNNEQQTFRWTQRHQVHQNAIHVVVRATLQDNSILIVTGGDDNAIGFTRVTSATTTTRIISSAHAAAVTGLVIIPPSRSSERFRLASSGIDQRVKLWEIEFESGKPGLEGMVIRRLQDVFTAVADAAGLEMCRLEDGEVGVLICGVGMEVWTLPS